MTTWYEKYPIVKPASSPTPAPSADEATPSDGGGWENQYPLVDHMPNVEAAKQAHKIMDTAQSEAGWDRHLRNVFTKKYEGLTPEMRRNAQAAQRFENMTFTPGTFGQSQVDPMTADVLKGIPGALEAANAPQVVRPSEGVVGSPQWLLSKEQQFRTVGDHDTADKLQGVRLEVEKDIKARNAKLASDAEEHAKLTGTLEPVKPMTFAQNFTNDFKRTIADYLPSISGTIGEWKSKTLIMTRPGAGLGGFLGQAAGNAAVMLPTMLAGPTSGAVTGSAQTAEKAMSLVNYLVTSTMGVKQTTDKIEEYFGKEPVRTWDEAFKKLPGDAPKIVSAIGAGLFEAGSEYLGAHYLDKIGEHAARKLGEAILDRDASKATSLILDHLAGASVEGVEELVSLYGQKYTEAITGVKPWGQAMSEILNEAPQTFFAGAAAGSFLTVASTAAHHTQTAAFPTMEELTSPHAVFEWVLGHPEQAKNIVDNQGSLSRADTAKIFGKQIRWSASQRATFADMVKEQSKGVEKLWKDFVGSIDFQSKIVKEGKRQVMEDMVNQFVDYANKNSKKVVAPPPSEEPKTEPAPPPTGKHGTLKEPNHEALSDHFAQQFQGGRRYDNINAARAEASKLLGGKVEPGTSAAKVVDEAVENGVVRTARAIIEQHRGNPDATFNAIMDLYDRQPKLNVRTSTSTRDQAYSTPAPMAYVISTLAGIHENSKVLEPTAGNGMLLIGADPKNVTANEINDTRRASLENQGFDATDRDASTPQAFGAKQYDAVIANPPFGRSEGRVWNLGPTKTSLIDHAIAWNALEAMNDDGRAVLLLGGPSNQVLSETAKDIQEKHYKSGVRTGFFYALYDNYNVVGHYTLSGKLYDKQGTAYPTDLIIIEGRGKSKLPKPQTSAPQLITSYDELKGLLHGLADSQLSGESVEPAGDQRPGDAGAGDTSDAVDGERDKNGPGPVPDGASDARSVDGGGSKSDAGGSTSADGERSDAESDAPAPQPPGRGGGGTDDQRPAADGAGKNGTGGGDASGDASESDSKQPRGGGSDQANGPESVAGADPRKLSPKLQNLDEAKRKKLEELAKKMKKRLGGGDEKGEMGMPGVDPELMQLGIQMGTELIDSGIYRFDEFAQTMATLVGPEITPTVKMIYAAVFMAQNADVQANMTGVMEVNALTQERVDDLAGINEPVEPEPPKKEPKPVVEQDGDGNPFQISYQPRSTSESVTTLLPRNMADRTSEALNRIEAEHGDIDTWVAESLGYSTQELASHFSGEQVDAIAMAIHNLHRGAGFIIGDQTGVGKGRVVAAVIRWAKKNDHIPIFVTEKASLFADMIRDLTDIGSSTKDQRFTPLITNNLTGNDVIQLDYEGDRRTLEAFDDHHNAVARILNDAAESGGVLENDAQTFDAVFTTYSQFQTVKETVPERVSAIDAIAPRSIFILDESHNAGGQGQKNADDAGGAIPRSRTIRRLLAKSAGAVYSSATFAKHPGVMDLYFTTDLSLAVENFDQLVTAMSNGGVPLQQVVAGQLAESGQYVRREKSFDGIEFTPRVIELGLEAARDLSSAIGEIYDIDRAIMQIIGGMNESAKTGGAKSRGDAGASKTGFSSILHNLVNQAILANKVPAVVQAAIEAHRAGEKPFIALANTLESFLTEEIERVGAAPGDPFEATFAALMARYLRKTRQYKSTDPLTGVVTIKELTDDQLGPVLTARYNALYDAIMENELLQAMPVSPIDAIAHQLQQAGIRVGEITGRSTILKHRSDGPPIITGRDTSERGNSGKINAIRGYNGVKGYDPVDVLIVNQSGSTGLSAHASPKVGDDLRRRHMIIAQADANIDTFMQMLGRINRTGQLTEPDKLPRYTLLLTDMPLEIRPAAVLMRKMASLNANTSASRKTNATFDAPDFINVVGDRIVAELMADRPDLHARMGNPLVQPQRDGSFKPQDAATKTTGRISLIGVDDQIEFYHEVETRYAERIKQLEALGINPLAAQTLDLQAITKSTHTVFEGIPNNPSPLAAGSVIETIRSKRIGKPMTSTELREALVESLNKMDTGDGPATDDMPNHRLKDMAVSGAARIVEQLETDTMAYIADELDKMRSTLEAGKADPRTIDDQLRHRRGRLEESFLRVRPWLRSHYIGQVVSVSEAESGEVFHGVITNIERKSQAKNPAAPSAWKVRIAVADPVRQLDVSLSQVLRSEHKTQVPFSIQPAMPEELQLYFGTRDISEAFDKSQVAGRETRHMVTGNLLSAYARGVPKGSIVHFTRDDGSMAQGILLPKKFNLAEWADDQPVHIPDHENVMKVLDSVRDVTLNNSDRTVSVRKDQRGYLFFVPKSKSQGGKYFLDKDILEAAKKEQPEGFVTVSNTRRLILRDRAAAMEIVRLLYAMGEPLVAYTQKDRVADAAGVKQQKVDDSEKGNEELGSPDPTQRLPDPAVAPERIINNMPSRLDPPEGYKRIISAPEVIDALANVLRAFGSDAPIRVGKVSKKYLGVFKVGPEVVRVRTANDITTAAHEVAHAIEKAVFGFEDGGPWVPPEIQQAMQKELLKLGKALYGSKKPTGGYKREGFAEFVRIWVTDPDSVRRVAPQFNTYFEKTFLAKTPNGRRAMEYARELATVWRTQGSLNRGSQSIVDPLSAGERFRTLRRTLRRDTLVATHVEMLDPLHTLARVAEAQLGRKLAPSEDPYATASAFRKAHVAIVERWINHKMTDFNSNGRDDVKPLADIAAMVKGRFAEWQLYLFAKRALALWTDPKGPRNPGMAFRDAQHIIKRLQSSAFDLAAGEFYKWNDAVLDYMAQASPSFAQVIKRIRKRDPGYYLPLAREFRQMEHIYDRMSSSAGGRPLGDSFIRSLRGSGRRIKAPIQQTVANTVRMVAAAHNRHILDQMIRLSGIEGMGHLIEEVPRDKVPVATRTLADLIEEIDRRIRSQGGEVEIHGDDLDLIGETVTFFASARYPQGGRPILPMYDRGNIRWFYVDAELFNAMSSVSQIYRLPRVADVLVGRPTRVFRAGTTGLRAGFGLVTNPLRDLGTFPRTTQGSINPASLTVDYFTALKDAFVHATIGQESPWIEAMLNLGVKMAQPLGQDIPHTRTAVRRLFQGRVVRTLDPRNAFDFYREFIQFPELAPRLAEFKRVAKEVGWKPGKPMSRDQAVTLTNAAKQVTTDFTAEGEFSRVMNQIVPFYNASIQGPRAHIRAFKRNPAKFMVVNLAIMASSLGMWWRYKDEDWYREMPIAERSLFWHFPTNWPDKTLIRIPRAFEIDLLFAALPETLMDAWYRREPEQVAEWAHTFWETAIPDVTPVLLREAYDQVDNKDHFFNTPIVPGRLERKPAHEQYDEFTSRFSINTTKIMKDVFDMEWSPKRLDHAVRGILGGAATDIVSLLGLGPTGVERESEPADLPIVGRVFPRGGQIGQRPRSIQQIYDTLASARLAAESDETQETEDQRQHRLMLEDAASAVSDLLYVRSHTAANADRQALTNRALELARTANAATPEDRPTFAAAKKEAELERAKAEGDADAVRKKIVSAARAATQTPPLSITPNEREQGITLPQKRQSWKQERSAAIDLLTQSGMNQTEIIRLFGAELNQKIKTPEKRRQYLDRLRSALSSK